MTSINPINVNSQGVGNSYGFGAKPKSMHEEAKAEEKSPASSQKTPVAADDVLSFMAQSAIAPAATKSVNPAKYVDKASADRIAGFMAEFEDKVAEGLANFDKEFGGVNVSDSSKMTLVLAGLNKEA